MDDGNLVFWEGSAKWAKSADGATKQFRCWIAQFKPDVVISENPDAAGAKRVVQIPILHALADVGQETSAINLLVRRQRPFANLYEEAKDLVDKFPALRTLAVKKPKIWAKEPYSLVFFDAMSLVRDAGLMGDR
ncbi:MAG: hypothetical protein ABJO27_27990 [Pseudoruegeria sp.]